MIEAYALTGVLIRGSNMKWFTFTLGSVDR